MIRDRQGIKRMVRHIMTSRWNLPLVLFCLGLIVTCGVYSLWPTVYEANSIFTMDFQDPKGDYDETSHEMDYYSNDDYGEIFEMQRSDWRTKDFFSRIIRQFHVTNFRLTVADRDLEEMLGNSTLERMGHSRRIRLAVYSPTAELAAALANTYVETIKLFTEERNKERCAKALVQIHQQVERAKNLSNEIYQDLLRAENEHRIAVERSNVSAFVLRAAQVPEKPVVPNPWVIFPTGAVLSLGLALVLRNCSCGCGSSRKAPRVTDSRR